MPFDNARSLVIEAADGPDCAAVEGAAARFDAPHPYLLFGPTALPEIRRRAAANPKLQARFAKLLSEASPPPLPQEPRAALKRRARRLINTAFLALTAEGSIAIPALAATRRGLAEFAAAPSWKERPVIRSFLDCAEIAVAVALAYDWLHDELTAGGAPGDRGRNPAQCARSPALRRLSRPFAAMAEAAGQLRAGFEFRHSRRCPFGLAAISAALDGSRGPKRGLGLERLFRDGAGRRLARGSQLLVARDAPCRSDYSGAGEHAGRQHWSLPSGRASPKLATSHYMPKVRLARPSILGIPISDMTPRRSFGSHTASRGGSTAGWRPAATAGRFPSRRFGQTASGLRR